MMEERSCWMLDLNQQLWCYLLRIHHPVPYPPPPQQPHIKKTNRQQLLHVVFLLFSLFVFSSSPVLPAHLIDVGFSSAQEKHSESVAAAPPLPPPSAPSAAHKECFQFLMQRAESEVPRTRGSGVVMMSSFKQMRGSTSPKIPSVL